MISWKCRAPECKKIAHETAEEIIKDNPNKGFRRYFESVGVMKFFV